MSALDTATEAECMHVIELAIGRMLRLGSRPAQPGDEEALDAVIGVVMQQVMPRLRELGSAYARDVDAEIVMRHDRRRRAGSW